LEIDMLTPGRDTETFRVPISFRNVLNTPHFSMPRQKKSKCNTQMKTDNEDDDEPRMMISVKMLAGYLPTINLKHDATVADLADAMISSDPDAYRDCRPVFIRAHADGSSEELEEESRRLSSFGLQCGVEEELVMWVENVSDLVSQVCEDRYFHFVRNTYSEFNPIDMIRT
jgi:hypothetical protein